MNWCLFYINYRTRISLLLFISQSSSFSSEEGSLDESEAFLLVKVDTISGIVSPSSGENRTGVTGLVDALSLESVSV